MLQARAYIASSPLTVIFSVRSTGKLLLITEY